MFLCRVFWQYTLDFADKCCKTKQKIYVIQPKSVRRAIWTNINSVPNKPWITNTSGLHVQDLYPSLRTCNHREQWRIQTIPTRCHQWIEILNGLWGFCLPSRKKNQHSNRMTPPPVLVHPPGWDASPSKGYPRALSSPIPIYTLGWRETLWK